MKRLVILILAVVLSSCGVQNPEVVPGPAENARVSMPHPTFNSEEEFMEFMQGDRDETALGTQSYLDIDEITHYYRLKNPPPGAIVDYIAVTSWVIIMYDTQEADVEYFSRTIMIHYAPDYFDIEKEGFWVRRIPPFDESHIFEKDGLTYYIWKGGTTWIAEWVNEDGYNMKANFPYCFTAEEVLGFVSDLERVEIG
jgi:hypothetical protein